MDRKNRFSDDWKVATLPQRAALLQEHIVRIEYNHETPELDVQLNEASLD
jgi:hypothetical protein